MTLPRHTARLLEARRLNDADIDPAAVARVRANVMRHAPTPTLGFWRRTMQHRLLIGAAVATFAAGGVAGWSAPTSSPLHVVRLVGEDIQRALGLCSRECERTSVPVTLAPPSPTTAPLHQGLTTANPLVSTKPTTAPTLTEQSPASPKPLPLFADNFDGDALGTAPSGWSASAAGVWSVTDDGSTNHVATHTRPTLDYLAAGSTSWTDYSATIRFRFSGGTAVGLSVRRVDAGNRFDCRYSAGKLTVAVVTGGVAHELRSVPTTVSGWSTLSFAARGQTLTCRLGSAVISGSSTLLPRGAIALLAVGGVDFDSVDVRS